MSAGNQYAKLTYYTIKELKNFSKQNNIRLGGLTRKADIINAIRDQSRNLNRLNESLSDSSVGNRNPDKSIIKLVKSNEDILYELSRHLTLKELRNLCLTNKEYQRICQHERVLELFRQKLKQEQEEMVNEIYNKAKKGFNYTFTYRDEGHVLSYYPRLGLLAEAVRVYTDERGNRLEDYRQQSILRRLFGTEAMIKNTRGGIYDGPNYRIDNSTSDQIKQVLNVLVHRPDFDINKVEYFE